MPLRPAFLPFFLSVYTDEAEVRNAWQHFGAVSDAWAGVPMPAARTVPACRSGRPPQVSVRKSLQNSKKRLESLGGIKIIPTFAPRKKYAY